MAFDANQATLTLSNEIDCTFTDHFIRKESSTTLVKRTWSLAGKLNQGRQGHGIVFDEGQFLVIGGHADHLKPDETLKTENCILNGGTVTCTRVGEGLSDYKYYPELALVANDYGIDC